MTVEGSQSSGGSIDLGTFSALLEQGKIQDAKILLRTKPITDIAGVWKSILVLRTKNKLIDNDSIYWDTVDTCFGSRNLEDCADQTPGCVDSHQLNYDLDTESKAQVCRLVTCIAYMSPDVPYCPLLYPSAALLRKFLSEAECFGFLSCLVSPSPGLTFFTQSRRSWDITCRALKPLALKYIKKHISELERSFGRDKVNSGLTGWIWWIFKYLPVRLITRIFTSFLLEGHKVLYRTGLAILKLFSKEIFKPGTNLSGSLASQIQIFCSNLAIPEEEFIRVGFKIQRFSKSDLAKIMVKLEMEVKAQNSIKIEDGGRRRSNQELLNSETVEDLVAVSDNLSYKQLVKIWNLIPERITMITPKLVYSSNDHGTSLQTFFNKTEKYEPTILVIKSYEGDVFGAYCSTTWACRNEKDDRGMRQTYFGTGETFLFKLDGDKVLKYPWVGENKEIEGRGNRAEQLYMSGDTTMITVGGGDGTGLYLDENLEFGRTEPCLTFNNPPLASDKNFTVSLIEVFGFNNLDD
ncbi:TBC1 domain family member 24 isoform X2 [Eurytemora carolleeae]|uniref:TBC1 domain family member 24 isoform X2 n=1 Tax=Eurytemora carolleeae TaxID=1294199 RepID=UPI000C76ED26|nr:TBC1 domain family member 24 isoform X2 [Eurytemora carolleeae]|eukprot:XP_023326393.1 TBC1 domain family member 24-like isoform X2 [Eurytemora affinis]